jgi:hypothetical protein
MPARCAFWGSDAESLHALARAFVCERAPDPCGLVAAPPGPPPLKLARIGSLAQLHGLEDSDPLSPPSYPPDAFEETETERVADSAVRPPGREIAAVGDAEAQPRAVSGSAAPPAAAPLESPLHPPAARPPDATESPPLPAVRGPPTMAVVQAPLPSAPRPLSGVGFVVKAPSFGAPPGPTVGPPPLKPPAPGVKRPSARAAAPPPATRAAALAAVPLSPLTAVTAAASAHPRPTKAVPPRRPLAIAEVPKKAARPRADAVSAPHGCDEQPRRPASAIIYRRVEEDSPAIPPAASVQTKT